MELNVLGQETNDEASSCASGSCGSSSDQMSHLSDEIKDKVKNHPCYSEEAHHYFARMHVAVAPACNIQCHYCNRKYDCSNESRPGVVSEVLSPEQAVKKTMAVAANIPQMTVLGIAGPGDPLANPERTFATFRMLSEQAPDIKLCVSTNGLALPEAVEELSKHNIDHVTITINTLDPEIGAKIYPWIYWNNKRIHGAKGAKILIKQQQKGLEMLAERGILVKVNSVMIPGVNDEHLKEVSRVVKSKGAFLHNVMPLIAEAEHGTFYGVMGQRGPTPEELMDLQDACSGDMNMMRHCRQCRADAVGLLGEDRGEEFTMDKIEAMDIDYESAMKTRAIVHEGILEELDEKEAKRARLAAVTIPKPEDKLDPALRPVLMAVATSGGGLINQHFGHATEFLIYEASPTGVRFKTHRKVDQFCIGGDTCGEKESALAGSIRALTGCETVLCSKIGYEPWSLLEDAGILPNGEHAMEPIEEAIEAVYKEMAASGKLEEPAPSQETLSA
ncbi:MAG: nitrogenase cofactor biosynthesis protein NifB [Oceanobacter sp.]